MICERFVKLLGLKSSVMKLNHKEMQLFNGNLVNEDLLVSVDSVNTFQDDIVLCKYKKN
ncbi:MAG: hypothetical protein HEEMFOPI_01896 [Holosporales bacterium]